MRSWRFLAAVAVVAVAVQIWGLYRVGGPPSPPWFPHADKVEHAVGFGAPLLLILLTLAARRRQLGTSRLQPRLVSAVVVAAFFVQAVVSEVVQHLFYATRTGDPYDVLADSVGIGLGVLAFSALRSTARRRSALA